jgi:hypothetical protein
MSSPSVLRKSNTPISSRFRVLTAPPANNNNNTPPPPPSRLASRTPPRSSPQQAPSTPLPPTSRATSPYHQQSLQADNDAALALVTARLMEAQREIARLNKLIANPEVLAQCLELVAKLERKKKRRG